MHKCIQKFHPLLVMKNLPLQLKKTNFTRQELHEVFSRYRALLTMECHNIKGMDASSIMEINIFSVAQRSNIY